LKEKIEIKEVSAAKSREQGNTNFKNRKYKDIFFKENINKTLLNLPKQQLRCM